MTVFGAIRLIRLSTLTRLTKPLKVRMIRSPIGLFATFFTTYAPPDFHLINSETSILKTVTPVDGEGDDADSEAPTKSGKRVKYVCPRGDMKAWAKHDAKLVCGEHMEPMLADHPVPPGYRDITPTSQEEA